MITTIPFHVTFCFDVSVTSCPALPAPVAGQFECNDSSLDLLNGDHGNGTVCTLKCDPHFGAGGPGAVLCQKDGTWNSSSTPTCQRGN